MLTDRIRCYDKAIRYGEGGTPEREYLETREPKFLVLHDGMKPIVYRCAPLTHDTYGWVDEGASDHAKRARAFAASVRAVVYADRTWTPERCDERGYRSMTADELAAHAVPDVAEIGQQVIDEATRPLDSPADFSRPLSSLRALVARERLSRSAA